MDQPLAGLRSRRQPSRPLPLEVSTTIGPAAVSASVGDSEAVDVGGTTSSNTIGPLIVDRRQRRGSVTDLTDDREPVSLQQAAGEPTEPGVAVDDQHRPRHGSHRAADPAWTLGASPKSRGPVAASSGRSSMRPERDATSLVRMVDRDLLRPFQRGGYSKARPGRFTWGHRRASGRGAGIGVVDEDTGSTSSPPGPIGYGRIGATLVGGGRVTDMGPSCRRRARCQHRRDPGHDTPVHRACSGRLSVSGLPSGRVVKGRRATHVWSRWVVSYGVSSVARGCRWWWSSRRCETTLERSALWVSDRRRRSAGAVCRVFVGRRRFGWPDVIGSGSCAGRRPVVRLGVLFVLTVLVVTRAAARAVGGDAVRADGGGYAGLPVSGGGDAGRDAGRAAGSGPTR